MAKRPDEVEVTIRIKPRTVRMVRHLAELSECIESLAEDLAWRDEPKRAAELIARLYDDLQAEIRFE